MCSRILVVVSPSRFLRRTLRSTLQSKHGTSPARFAAASLVPCMNDHEKESFYPLGQMREHELLRLQYQRRPLQHFVEFLLGNASRLSSLVPASVSPLHCIPSQHKETSQQEEHVVSAVRSVHCNLSSEQPYLADPSVHIKGASPAVHDAS
jgi:hypothetical protein